MNPKEEAGRLRSIVVVVYGMASVSDEHISRTSQSTKRQQPTCTIQTAPRSHIRRSSLSDDVAGHHHHAFPGAKVG